MNGVYDVLICRSGNSMEWATHVRLYCVPSYALGIAPCPDGEEPECDGHFAAGWCVQPFPLLLFAYRLTRCSIFCVSWCSRDEPAIADEVPYFSE